MGEEAKAILKRMEPGLSPQKRSRDYLLKIEAGFVSSKKKPGLSPQQKKSKFVPQQKEAEHILEILGISIQSRAYFLKVEHTP